MIDVLLDFIVSLVFETIIGLPGLPKNSDAFRRRRRIVIIFLTLFIAAIVVVLALLNTYGVL